MPISGVGTVGARFIAPASGARRGQGAMNGVPAARPSRGIARARSWRVRLWALAIVGVQLAAACAPSAPASGDGAAAANASRAAVAEPARDVTVAIPAQSLSTFPLVLGQEDGI